jgi:hypothetical protein
MDLIIRDAWFGSHSVVDVNPGDDRLVFERCTFMSGTVHADPEVDRQIFVACLFPGTTFSAQSLSPRISTGCQAGLDLGAKTPEEIALSVLSEIVIHRRRGTGDPMRGKLQDRAGRHLATEAAT